MIGASNKRNNGNTEMEECEALAMIREARALLRVESINNSSRELSMVLTKLDEAVLWRQQDMQLKTPSTNEHG